GGVVFAFNRKDRNHSHRGVYRERAIWQHDEGICIRKPPSVWSINWITLWGVVIFNTLVVTGNFDRFKKWMVRHATADIRIQTIMLASAFGAILERLVGCGYLWAGVSRLREGLAMPDRGAIRVAPLP